MRSSKLFLTAIAITLAAAAARAAHVDFSDPRRATGREDDIRVDAQLGDDTVSSGAPISITYQIENLSKSVVALADKITDTDYDSDSQTITISIGAEVPAGPNLPHIVTIKPGERRVFTAGTFVHVAVPAVRTQWTVVPRYVQIKVTLLRDVTPFARLIELQATSAVPPVLPNGMFDRWVESTDSVFLNAIPVRWKAGSPIMSADREHPLPGPR